MIKKIALYFVVGGTLLFVTFQIYTFFHVMLYMETTTIAGEEDVVIRSGNLSKNELTITCNVDWGEDILPEMLEIFKEKGIKVTFFVSGKWAEKHSYLLRQMFVAGHEIQNHGYGHKLCSGISAEGIRNEIQMTEDIIYNLIGIRTTVFAPPAGDYNIDTVNLCRKMRYHLSLWSADTIDWREGSNAAIITKRILKKPLKGAIILMHPKIETAKALPGLIDEIERQGIEIVPLYQLR